MDALKWVRAGALNGIPIEEAGEFVRTLAHTNGGISDVEWALKEVDAVYAGKGVRNISGDVSEFVDSSVGWFTTADIDRELQLSTKQDRGARRSALFKLAGEKVIERHHLQEGRYRRIEGGLEIIDWQNADLREMDIEWPFGLHEWEITYPGTLDVIAGSSGAGKTAFMLDFLLRNQAKHNCRYISSEMSPQQMRHRLGKFNAGQWNFEAVRASSNFADLVLADSVTIIDYLEIDGENPSGVVNEIRKIFDALKTGMALVGLQKKGNTKGKFGSVYELGRGGAFSMEKARLYLSMDYNELLVVKSSNRRDDDAPTLKGRKWGFDLYKGCIFTDIYEKYGEGE